MKSLKNKNKLVKHNIVHSFYTQTKLHLFSSVLPLITKMKSEKYQMVCFYWVLKTCLLFVRWWVTPLIRWTRAWTPSIMRLFTHCWIPSAPDIEKHLEMLCYRDWRGSNKMDSDGFSIILLANSFTKSCAALSLKHQWYLYQFLACDMF